VEYTLDGRIPERTIEPAVFVTPVETAPSFKEIDRYRDDLSPNPSLQRTRQRRRAAELEYR